MCQYEQNRSKPNIDNGISRGNDPCFCAVVCRLAHAAAAKEAGIKVQDNEMTGVRDVPWDSSPTTL